MIFSRLPSVVIVALWPAILMAQAPPHTPTICEDCWPTECGPGKWSATGELHAHKHPSDSLPPLFSLRAGDTFYVDSSVVRVNQFGLAIVRERFDEYAPGDTLVITDCGEGYCGIWWRGRPRLERNVWSGGSPRAELVRQLQQQWWIHGRQGTRSGWILKSDSTPVRHLECP